MIILKLGGSVVTVKDKPMTVHRENLQRLAREISTARPEALIIVHGGGSFGHPVARKHRITTGFESPNQLIGFSKTHQAMVELNSLVIQSLLEASLPVVSLTPSSFIVTNQGRIELAEFNIVRQALDRGFIPTLYGDAVLDRSKGCSILSGDQLAAYLAVELGARRLVFGVDVDGVYTSNPKTDLDAQLIENLSLQEMKQSVEAGEATATDVTGGMSGKLCEATAAVEAGVQVLIANASKPGVILKALRGEPITGTLLTR